ncbi:MAG: cell division protein FtsZ, partial [bacterium]|nr:cell division protein FtsZ [bacterium]
MAKKKKKKAIKVKVRVKAPPSSRSAGLRRASKTKSVVRSKVKLTIAKPEVQEDDLKTKRTKVRVIGIGDGGSNIVLQLSKSLPRVEFAVANTDWRMQKKFSNQVKILNFGEKYTHGAGAGSDVELARQAGLAEKDKIAKFLKGTDLCFLVSCLGGGTGSGASPVFARLAQQEGALTFGIFTLPFKFEGEKKMEVAREALEKVRPYLNAVLVLPNEKLFQALDKDISFNEGFLAVNELLSRGLEGLIGLVFQPGLINIDFADLQTILEGRGKAAFLANCEFARGTKVEDIKKKIFQSPFLGYNFRHARAVLFNIVSDTNLSLNEVSEISQLVFNAVHPEAKIIFGVSFNNKLAGAIRVVLLAIGGRDKGLGAVRKPRKKSKVSKKIKNKKDGSLKDGTNKIEEKIRRNALQIKEEVSAQEENIAAQEQLWETPAILRKGL